jgi:AraC-like DNA-binding protein
MSELTIVASGVRALMEFAVSKGACREALAGRSGIDPAELQDPDNRIPFDRYVALMRAGQELCDDPALALHFGESVDVSGISFACLLGPPSGSWADGFGEMNRYGRLSVEVETVGGGDRFQLVRDAGQVWVVDTRSNPNDFPELTESAFARAVCTSRRMFGEMRFLEEVHVTHAAPAYRAEYERIFQVPVVFESDRNALLTNDAWLTLTTPIFPPYVTEVLRAHAETLLQKLDSSKTTKGRVESLLMPMLHTGDASIETVAGRLGLSRQTLFRKLKAEGVTFEKVLDGLRHRLALEYLSREKVSVNETAYLVGFSDPAAFSRAFKRWTGASPRMMRAAKLDDGRTISP